MTDTKEKISIEEIRKGLSPLFNEFYSLAFRMYVDTRKLRDAQAKAILQFLKARGL